MWKQYITNLRDEFEGYNTQKLTKDIMAGLTVAAVSLPLALAFGVSNGATAASGMITAIIAGFVMSALSGVSFQISGPTGSMAGILLVIVAGYGMEGVFIVTFLAGVILFISAFLKIGRLVSIIPTPVITGFTSGISLIIGLGQIDNFFGVTSKGNSIIERFASYEILGFSPNWFTVAVGGITICTMLLWPKKLNARFPSSLLAIIVSTLVCTLAKWDVSLVGVIPKTLLAEQRFHFISLNMEKVATFIMPAVGIAALVMIESLLCGASGSRMTGKKLNADIEMVAQGVGNMVIPFFGGLPAAFAIARTSMAIKSGGQTRLTGVFHAVSLLVAMFLLGGIMSKIPLASLAGVLMVTAVRMNDWSTISYFFRKKFKGASGKFLITMIATVVFDLTTAIIIGVVFSVLLIVIKLSDVEVNAAKVDLETINGYEGLHKEMLKESVVIYITGPVFFGSLEKINNMVKEYRDAKVIIFSLRGVPMIDTSGVQSCDELCDRILSENKKVIFSSVQPKVKSMMERGGIVEKIGEDKFYWSVERVLADKNLFIK